MAKPKVIEREWRLVIAEGRPIAASQYHEAGSKFVRRGCPSEVRDFAEGILDESRWEPDPIFEMDVCEAEGKLNVVELNGFSCAGLYDCDLCPIIAKAAEMAEQAWNQKHL